MSYLDSLQSPEDIRPLGLAQLKELAGEIRQVILETVAKNGGHLASSLGAVELAVGLHHAYQTPRDKIIWDVGHQGYPHKLLTGRYARFSTLRKGAGISGFLRRSESEYDVFGAGHAGTSISAALGIAQARDLKNEDFKVIAVIGDGSMTCGLPFEGLNNAGHTETDLLVVLNDNEMSITAMWARCQQLSRTRWSSKFYNMRKEQASSFRAAACPVSGNWRAAPKSMSRAWCRQATLFEELGFSYIGPDRRPRPGCSGHDPAQPEGLAAGAPFPACGDQEGQGLPARRTGSRGVSRGRHLRPPKDHLPKAKPSSPSYTEVFGTPWLCDTAEQEPKLAWNYAGHARRLGASGVLRTLSRSLFRCGHRRDSMR